MSVSSSSSVCGVKRAREWESLLDDEPTIKRARTELVVEKCQTIIAEASAKLLTLTANSTDTATNLKFIDLMSSWTTLRMLFAGVPIFQMNQEEENGSGFIYKHLYNVSLFCWLVGGQENNREAIKHCTDALNLTGLKDLDRSQLYCQLVRSLVALGDVDGCVNVISKAAETFDEGSNNQSDLFAALAALLIMRNREGDLKKAENLLRKALECKPRIPAYAAVEKLLNSLQNQPVAKQEDR
jgi:hypothetical protein